MLRWYQAQLAARPLLTQSVTTAILFGTGDVMAQQLVERKGAQKHDLARTSRMALYGGAVFGPGATLWYRVLQRINVGGPSSMSTIGARVVADQLVFTPINMLCFLSSQALLEGTSPRDKLASTYVPAIKANWTLWPWVQAANFTLVPLHHRVLVVNVVSLGWNCYLSWLNGGGASKSTVDTAAEELHDKTSLKRSKIA